MEWADARAKLRERLQGGVDAGLPCVYVVSYDQADPPTKVGMVSYGQLNHRMGSFRTWARSFYLHALLYTEYPAVRALEKEFHGVLPPSKRLFLSAPAGTTPHQKSEWFDMKPGAVVRHIKKLATHMVTVLLFGHNGINDRYRLTKQQRNPTVVVHRNPRAAHERIGDTIPYATNQTLVHVDRRTLHYATVKAKAKPRTNVRAHYQKIVGKPFVHRGTKYVAIAIAKRRHRWVCSCYDIDHHKHRVFALMDVLAMLKVQQKFWDGAEHLGKLVRKAFGLRRRRKYFQGEVVSYDYAEKLYMVVYEDGDREELSRGEVEELLLPRPHGEAAAAVTAARARRQPSRSTRPRSARVLHRQRRGNKNRSRGKGGGARRRWPESVGARAARRGASRLPTTGGKHHLTVRRVVT